MPPGPNPELRRQVIAIYKGKSSIRACEPKACFSLKAYTTRGPELLFLGRDYPQGYDWFRPRLHKAFMAKANLTDEEEIKRGIASAEFVRKGTVWCRRDESSQDSTAWLTWVECTTEIEAL